MCIYNNAVSVINRRFERKTVFVKCGHCIECLKERQNGWKLRLIKEASFWNHVYFFTLTFDDAHLPCVVVDRELYDSYLFRGTLSECVAYADKHGLEYDIEATMKGCDIDSLINYGNFHPYAIKSTADNKRVSNFIKRIRTNFSRNECRRLVCKYFICSEYGASEHGTRRPHYHGVLFSNEDYNTLAPYFNSWQSIGRMEFKQSMAKEGDTLTNSHSRIANYVSKYCAKGSFDSRQDDTLNRHIEKARFSCSNGIGSRWFEERKEDWLKYVPSCIAFEDKFNFIPFDEAITEKYFETGALYMPLFGNYYPLNVDLVGRVKEDSYPYILRDKLRQEIETLCDNLLVYDGAYGYKMPRYVYERLFLRKIVEERTVFTKSVDVDSFNMRDYAVRAMFPFLGVEDGINVEYIVSPPHHIIRGTFLNPLNYVLPYKNSLHKVTRFVSESFLSNAIAYCLRMRAKAEFDRAVSEAVSNVFCPSIEDAIAQVNRRKDLAREKRAEMLTSKMHDFYFSQSLKHPEFD